LGPNGQTCLFDEYVFTPNAKVIPNVTYKTSNGKTAAVFETVIPGFGFVVEVVTFRVKYRGAFNSGSAYPANMSSVSTNVTARACKVTSGATNSVTLPTLVSASLKATGDVASARSAPFSVGLNCDANVSVYATLTDASNPANTGSALSLAPGSTAAGIGIQILKKGEGTPLSFGPDSSRKGNINQWMVGKSSTANTQLSVPFEARYVKVAETIKPGSVSARGTITFSYQ